MSHLIEDMFANEILKRSAIVQRLEAHPSWIDAIEQSVQFLDLFRDKWINRGRSEKQFIVVVGCKKESDIVPLGVCITAISGSQFVGKRMENSLTGDEGEDISVDEKHILDWHYQDAHELMGGALYRVLLAEQSKVTQRTIREGAPFYVRVNNELVPKVREVFSAVANRVGNLNQYELQDCLACGFQEYTFATRLDAVTSTSELTVGDYACIFGSEDIVRDLYALKLISNQSEVSPLELSVLYGNTETTKTLLTLSETINPVHEDADGTPLHTASSRGYCEIACLLLEHGADVMARDNSGCTPLHLASTVTIAEMLISAGADVHAIDDNGRTVLELQLDNQHIEVAAFLSQLGARAGLLKYQPDVYLSESETFAAMEAALTSPEEQAMFKAFMEATEVDFGAVLPIRILGH
jgi:hypothetical protein